jgi:hypothetical protein
MAKGGLRRQGRWYGRALRGLRPDRNPLRRTVDRVEACLLTALFVAAAVAAPFAAEAASHGAYASALRAEQAQVASIRQVRAVLARPAGRASDGYTVTSLVPVQATWTSVTGARQSGQVLAPAGSPKGTAVTVWTDAAGNLTSPPLQPSQVAGAAEVAAAGAVVAVVLLWLCGTVIARYVLNKRRMAAWEADWIVTSRAWNRQRW